MPFTPFHLGPGTFFKALLQGSFSLMVFGWAQIVMDIQPLLVLISGEGQLHGFSHTYVGASLLTLIAAITGKYLAEFGLRVLSIATDRVSFLIAFASALVGCFSHVLLDSIMHSDLEPFFPFTPNNPFLSLISVASLHKLCLYSGFVGGVIYFLIQWYNRIKTKS